MIEWEEKEYSENLDWNSWKKLLRYMYPYKKYMIILAIIMVFNAGVDAAFPMFTKYAVDNFIIPKSTLGLNSFIIAFASMICFQAFNIWLLIALAGKVDMGICYDIRKKGFEKLQELSYSYYDKTPTGWIISRLTSDSGRLSDTIAWGLVDVSWGLSMMFGVSIIMFVMNWKLALIALSVAPVLMYISIWFQKRLLKEYRDVRKINSKMTGAINEGIMGAKTSKTLVREKQNTAEFKNLTDKYYKSSVKSAVLSSIFMPAVLTLGAIGTGLILWRGGNAYWTQAITVGTFIAFIQYTVQFFDPVYELARMFAELQSAQAAAERLLTLLESEPDITDNDDIVKKYGTVMNPNKEIYPDIIGDIEFKNINFQYGNGEKVFEDFNLKINAGQTVALVGETGSGKTSLVNLICRFYEPQSGQILIDGVDLKDRSLDWIHSNLGYVIQNPHLFKGTIKDNIRYGNLNATDEEIIEASKLVQAHDFIDLMDKKYDSEIGEGGNSLSTGQKQLISFARAIIADPAIFILDEATSSIDTEMEKKIQLAISKVLKNRTSLIVAHRLSTIVDADVIIVLKNGKIIEMGKHKQLLKNKDYYYKLYTKQFLQSKEQEIEACS
jgi:ATP-binding cassette subfamily B protein